MNWKIWSCYKKLNLRLWIITAALFSFWLSLGSLAFLAFCRWSCCWFWLISFNCSEHAFLLFWFRFIVSFLIFFLVIHPRTYLCSVSTLDDISLRNLLYFVLASHLLTQLCTKTIFRIWKWIIYLCSKSFSLNL